MNSCGIDTSKFFGEPVSFGSFSLGSGGQPPPQVNITENIEKAGCSGGSRSYSISIQGEFVCCEPSEKISLAESFLSAFSLDCGNFSGGGLSLDGTRVNSVEVSSSDYIGNVPYSASLTWNDPNYGSGAVSNPVNSVQASQNDDSVTITHTVSAEAPVSQGGCSTCADCDMSEVQGYVNGLISNDSSPPTPLSFSLPNNPNVSGSDCPTVTEESDPDRCFFSITKVWTIDKNLNLNNSNYGSDIIVTQCEETSYDENDKETFSVSGSISFEGSVSCDPSCDDSLSRITSAMQSEVDIAMSLRSGRKANVSKSITEGANPSANYTVTFNPEPDDASGQPCKSTSSVSVSFGSDGVGSVSVQMNATANQSNVKSSSENCLCEAASGCVGNQGEARSKAMEMYGLVKGAMGASMQNLQGPCANQNSLGGEPEDSDEGECEGGSISSSYSWSDKEESVDAKWNYSVNVTRPVEIVSIQNSVGGGYCVTKTGKFTKGSVSVQGSRSQTCPDDPDFDTDSIAQQFAQQYSGANNLQADSNCSETVTGDGEANTFNKSFNWQPNGPTPPGINITPRGPVKI